VNSVTVSVVVPTYCRPDLLRRCLTALRGQIRPPDETIVVVRASDSASRSVFNAARSSSDKLIEVEEPGVLAAMRAGVASTAGEVIAFTDDDAQPRPGWLERLLTLLSEPGVGAAGGRDIIAGQTEPRRSDVGRITGYGKVVGNHHLGIGPVRHVDVLKGVNMAFRAECLALPRAGLLRGDGAEVSFEVLCARWAKLHGWRVVYDPSAEVDHAGAERIGADRRDRPELRAVRDAAHNSLIATAALDRRYLPRQASYAFAFGSRDAPGAGRALVAVARREREVLRRVGPSLAGSTLALTRLVRGIHPPPMVSCSELRASREAPFTVA
jgi:GT2 family glycosyltransferase